MGLRDGLILGLRDEGEEKVGRRGCEGCALSRAAIGIKPKTRFRFFPNLAHGGSLCAPLTSLAARKKSRFAEKKSASPKKNCACGGGVGVGIEGRAIVAIDAIDAIVAIEIVGVEGRGCCGLGGCGGWICLS